MSRQKKKIGDFLIRSKIPVDIEDNKEYKRVTIRINHNGVSLRDIEKGKKIGTKKQFILKAGQFILSKIDARYGAFGIAPDEVDGAIITGNFWAYDFDKKKINIDWLNQYTNSPEFYDICERASSGITHRKYLDEQVFLNHEIYLPDSSEQKIAVENVREQKKSFGFLTDELLHQQDLLKQLRQSFLREAMQGKLVKQVKKDGNAKELLQKIKAEKEKLIAEKKLKKEKPLPPIKEEEIPFEIPENWVWCRLGDILTEIKYGTSQSCDYDSTKNSKVLRIPNVSGGVLNGEDLKFTNLNVKEQKELSLQENDILIIRSNGSRDLVGKTVLVTSEFVGFTYAGYLVRFRFNKNLTNPNFLWLATISPFFRELIETPLRTTVGINNINTEEMSNLLIPLPPLAEQKRIVKKLEEGMNLCEELKTTITNNKTYTNQFLQVALKEALQMSEPQMEMIK